MNGKPKGKLGMSLSDLLQEYFVSRPGLRQTSKDQYGYTLRAFEKFLGRKATLADLNEKTISGYISHRLEKYSPFSIKRDRTSFIVWWRYGARRKLIPPPPIEGIPVVHVPRRNPTAWTLKELEQLLATCAKLRGLMLREGDKVRGRHIWPSGVPRAKWWSALFLFLYDTGCRIGAALAVTPSALDLERGLVVLRSEFSKTGIEQVLRLSRQTVSAIADILDPQAKVVWYFGWKRRAIWTQLKDILVQAGLPHDRTRKFHCFRRTTATLTAAAGRFDLAQSTLGHTNGQMTQRYIDRRAAPSLSAADVLPRPIFELLPSPAAPERPRDPMADVLTALSGEQREMLLKLVGTLFGLAPTNPTPAK